MARALLLDALGTLVRLDDPVARLAAALAARGVEVSPRAAAQAMRAEIAYYRGEHDRAGTRAGLALLRDDCAAVVERELATGLPAADLRAALLESIRFVPFAEVDAVLDRFAADGVALAVVSNWDISLHDVLDELGWTPRFGAVVTSAELGVAKPDPQPFVVALEALGVAPGDAVHVGDDLDADVHGARAAGVRALLLARDGHAGVPPGVEVVHSLGEVVL